MEFTLADLGWSAFFAAQSADAPGLHPARVAAVHRDRLTVLSPDGRGVLLPEAPAGDHAVGDWVLHDGARARRILERETLLARRAAGTSARRQLIAANVDTLYIVTSCDAEFNPARLERYLALAHEAGCFPVIVLTKADTAADPRDFERRAEALAPILTALAVDARDPHDVARVMAWCGQGRTAALVGSSGVGKTTLSNGMTGADEATQDVRADDAKGRHTTTHRSLRRMADGGWLIDTPGMRALRLADADTGIDGVFPDVAELAAACRFSDCGHAGEPGCVVEAAIGEGRLDPARLARWRKLGAESRRNSETLAETRARDKTFGRMIRDIQGEMRGQKGY